MIDKLVETVVKETGKKMTDSLPDFFQKDKQKLLSIGNNDNESSPVAHFVRSEIDTEVENKKIEEKSEYSNEVNEYIATQAELELYQEANLEETQIDEKKALTRTDINSEQIDENTGETNLERMQKGKPPLDKDGNPIELHHIGQESDSPLAELTKNEHRGKGNDGVLHDKTEDTKIDRKAFEKEKVDHWKARAEQISQGAIT